jgi:hypothetical protein
VAHFSAKKNPSDDDIRRGSFALSATLISPGLAGQEVAPGVHNICEPVAKAS